ncbi:Uncharacterised protein [Actinobacillus pleuropneumoniae]|nr:Uncharacterised protein [Actinobacillus pleuropneumoniae]
MFMFTKHLSAIFISQYDYVGFSLADAEEL